MNKKIIVTSILLIIVISATLLYVSFNMQDTITNQKNYPSSDDNITEDDISEEINDYFIPENDEIEIGDMI